MLQCSILLKFWVRNVYCGVMFELLDYMKFWLSFDLIKKFPEHKRVRSFNQHEKTFLWRFNWLGKTCTKCRVENTISWNGVLAILKDKKEEAMWTLEFFSFWFLVHWDMNKQLHILLEPGVFPTAMPTSPWWSVPPASMPKEILQTCVCWCCQLNMIYNHLRDGTLDILVTGYCDYVAIWKDPS